MKKLYVLICLVLLFSIKTFSERSNFIINVGDKVLIFNRLTYGHYSITTKSLPELKTKVDTFIGNLCIDPSIDISSDNKYISYYLNKRKTLIIHNLVNNKRKVIPYNYNFKIKNSKETLKVIYKNNSYYWSRVMYENPNVIVINGTYGSIIYNIETDSSTWYKKNYVLLQKVGNKSILSEVVFCKTGEICYHLKLFSYKNGKIKRLERHEESNAIKYNLWVVNSYMFKRNYKPVFKDKDLSEISYGIIYLPKEGKGYVYHVDMKTKKESVFYLQSY